MTTTNSQVLVAMLEGLFGNATAEKVLFFVALNRQGYAQEISTRLGVPLTSVQNQLRRLERGGVLVALVRGRMRLYELNPRYAVGPELEALLRRAFDLLPERDRERYVVRRRPRAAGKPL